MLYRSLGFPSYWQRQNPRLHGEIDPLGEYRDVQIYEETFEQLCSRMHLSEEFRKQLEIRFEEEGGNDGHAPIDAGGPTKEWYRVGWLECPH